MIYTDNEQLLKEYKKLLIDKGKTQTEIARALGMTRQAFASYTGKANFTCADLARLLAPLGYCLSVEYVPIEDRND